RHTMSKRDWSSDVCSSDLRRPRGYGARGTGAGARLGAPSARHPRAARHVVGSHTAAACLQSSLRGGSTMITLSIRYTIEARKRPDFERYARSLTKIRSEEHTSELQSRFDLVCRLLLEKK